MHGRDSHELSARLHSLSHIAHPTSGSWRGSSYVWVRCEVSGAPINGSFSFSVLGSAPSLPRSSESASPSVPCGPLQPIWPFALRDSSSFVRFTLLSLLSSGFYSAGFRSSSTRPYPPRTLRSLRRRCGIWTPTRWTIDPTLFSLPFLVRNPPSASQPSRS